MIISRDWQLIQICKFLQFSANLQFSPNCRLQIANLQIANCAQKSNAITCAQPNRPTETETDQDCIQERNM